MKTSLVIKEGRTQLVLSSESGHDQAVLKVLEKLPNAQRGTFYDNQAGYTRMTTDRVANDLIIVFDELQKGNE